MQFRLLLMLAFFGTITTGVCQTPFMITNFPAIANGAGPVYPATCNSFFIFKNRAYFVLSNDSTGPHLWSTDGTSAGTQLATNDSISTGEGAALGYLDSSYFIFSGGTNWCGGEVWKSDGTPAGCQLLTCIDYDSQGSGGGYGGDYCEPDQRNFFNLGGTYYFYCAGWVNSQLLSGLWQLDNSTGGATLYSWLRKFGSIYLKAIQLGNILIGTGYDAAHGYQLWRSDGTNAGTYMIKDLAPAPNSSFWEAEDGYSFNGNVYFFADTTGLNGTNRVLFKTDGTDTGTLPIWQFEGDGEFYCTLGNYLYFVATDSATGQQIWKTDGTSAGTAVVTNVDSIWTTWPVSLYPYQSNILFQLYGGNGLFATNGVNQGVSFDDSVYTASAFYTATNGKLYFSASAKAHYTDYELWASDGTLAGTHQIAQINKQPTFATANVNYITQLNNTLLFSATDGIHNNQLWGIYLNPGNSCNAGFEIFPDTGQGNYIGYNLSTGNHLNYLWDFGDSPHIHRLISHHIYSQPGIYQVCLTVYDGDSCSSYFLRFFFLRIACQSRAYDPFEYFRTRRYRYK